ncbi:hypothetical protein DFH09DRAFT_1090378 [Mycena vulgaris]|nr:hypothetical protein DFH09DRAFT_1090378 [Mycena vulgaris]
MYTAAQHEECHRHRDTACHGRTPTWLIAPITPVPVLSARNSVQRRWAARTCKSRALAETPSRESVRLALARAPPRMSAIGARGNDSDYDATPTASTWLIAPITPVPVLSARNSVRRRWATRIYKSRALAQIPSRESVPLALAHALPRMSAIGARGHDYDATPIASTAEMRSRSSSSCHGARALPGTRCTGRNPSSQAATREDRAVPAGSHPTLLIHAVSDGAKSYMNGCILAARCTAAGDYKQRSWGINLKKRTWKIPLEMQQRRVCGSEQSDKGINERGSGREVEHQRVRKALLGDGAEGWASEWAGRSWSRYGAKLAREDTAWSGLGPLIRDDRDLPRPSTARTQQLGNTQAAQLKSTCRSHVAQRSTRVTRRLPALTGGLFKHSVITHTFWCPQPDMG